jgi:3-methyladenine DNA glycosylase AlkD
MVLGLMKSDLSVILKYVKDFIPHINDWSVNDTFCQSFKIAKKYQKEVWDFLMNYVNSNKEFELRVVVVMMMCHFINDEYINSVIEFIDQTKHNGYYYKMGCAWCLQVIMVKYPDLCYNYLECNHLDDWTFNKAIRKMIESYRISDDMKDKIRKLIRK